MALPLSDLAVFVLTRFTQSCAHWIGLIKGKSRT